MFVLRRMWNLSLILAFTGPGFSGCPFHSLRYQPKQSDHLACKPRSVDGLYFKCPVTSVCLANQQIDFIHHKHF